MRKPGRKLTVIEFVSLDGVIQSPGSPYEDTSGDFTQGGWISSEVDSQLSQVLRSEMASEFDLVLGRKTFQIWSDYWPEHRELWPQVMEAKKYVASRSKPPLCWENSIYLPSDLYSAVLGLKAEPGPELRVYGNSELLPDLFRARLVDELRLRVFPLILGGGKKLFSQNIPEANFKLERSETTSKGVLMLAYRRLSNE